MTNQVRIAGQTEHPPSIATHRDVNITQDNKPHFTLPITHSLSIAYLTHHYHSLNSLPYPSLSFSHQVLSADGDVQVGKISKQWSGLIKEAFTDTDNFGVSFPADLDVRMKATLLGAVFLIVSVDVDAGFISSLFSLAALYPVLICLYSTLLVSPYLLNLLSLSLC